ncbi:hypothetical protein H2199_003373 [Coniosporium tulheliwenetii]|nr:hypothetical protein H2199_003373 [Cladosporium sp. JES 115]
MEEPVPRNKPKPSISRDYRISEYDAYESKQGKQRKPSKHIDVPGLKTAPLEKDRSFRDMMMSSAIRNRSADRQGAADSDDDRLSAPREGREGPLLSNSFNEKTGSSFLSNIKHSGTRAADGIGKAGKGIFSKLARSGSSNEKEQPVVERDYVLRTIRLPLVEQTRKTRISKKLETSRDKTEFWMPALPWRCIDYLNLKGSEEEGLYRVPGSEKDVAYWQMRFDQEIDINLFDEKDLYDINIIATLFKRWLSSIPDEIFPKATQARIAAECKNAIKTPQLLKDELSKLPPYNYYLLFAITCHISLLHSCSESNKMNYHNLCICFQPCMKMDAFVFQFLVLDWRNCWQGCWTEKEYLQEEQRYAESAQQSSSSLHSEQRKGSQTSTNHTSERAISSSESSKPSITRSSTPERRLPPSNAPRSEQAVDGEAKPAQANQLKPEPNHSPSLAPLKPLSPIGSL